MNCQIQLTNIPIKVEVCYKKQDNYQVIKKWFIQNFNITHKQHNYNWSKVTIMFEHIDADNPEFFLQPGQMIQILNGLLITEKQIPILKIYSFQQLSNE